MMFEKISLLRLTVILLFAISFTVMGTLAPILYASYVPESEIMEMHDFAAQDTAVGEEEHYLCFDRTVHIETTATVFTELYLVNGDTDRRIEVGSEVMQRYFQQGRTQVITPMELPDNLDPGEYKYVLVVKMDMANGQVTRTLDYESGAFTVYATPDELNQSEPKTIC